METVLTRASVAALGDEIARGAVDADLVCDEALRAGDADRAAFVLLGAAANWPCVNA